MPLKEQSPAYVVIAALSCASTPDASSASATATTTIRLPLINPPPADRGSGYPDRFPGMPVLVLSDQPAQRVRRLWHPAAGGGSMIRRRHVLAALAAGLVPLAAGGGYSASAEQS